MTKLFAFVILIHEIIKLFTALKEYKKSMLSSVWPTVKGRVLMSRIFGLQEGESIRDTIRQETDDNPRMKTASSYPPYAYIPYVRFEYTINGTNYTSDKLTVYEKLRYNRDIIDARMQVEKLPVGSEVTVYYDPEDPRTGVLNPHDDEGMRKALHSRILSLVVWVIIFLVTLALPM